MNPLLVQSDLQLLMVDIWLFRDETPLTLIGPTVTGTTFTYTTQLNSFGTSDSGNYTCTAEIRPQPTLYYIAIDYMLTSSINISTGKFITD